MRRVQYFAYGSNLDPDQMAERCPSARPVGRARLRDHRLDFTYFSSRWRGGSADVVPESGQKVWGVIYEMSPEDLNRLDRFEGGYQRVLLWVEDEAREPRLVVSYSVRTKRSFRPTERYLGRILRWAEQWKLPEDYLARLREVPAVDPPERRPGGAREARPGGAE